MKRKTLRLPVQLNDELEIISAKTGLSVRSLILLATLNSIHKFSQQSR